MIEAEVSMEKQNKLQFLDFPPHRAAMDFTSSEEDEEPSFKLAKVLRTFTPWPIFAERGPGVVAHIAPGRGDVQLLRK